MFEYQNNNYENRNQMYDYYHMPENGEPVSPKPSGHKKSGKAGRLAKKIGAITLSAALFGSVAAGSFQAVNTLISHTDASGETASAIAQNTNASLLKAAALSDTALAKGSLDVSDIAETVMPSIVSITNKSVQEVQNYFSMFGYGGQTVPQETESRGSGIIIGKNDTELLIVTNNHVIENADTLSAGFVDNRVYEANVKGTDPANDLAVIAVPLESISADTMSQIAVASIGDSDSLKVGEQVVAIGNALGYGQSVTTGIVSATNRTMGSNTEVVNTSSQAEDLPTYIQTDAAINPGNSGGALVNMKGEVIGINSAKMASTEVEGMGYAIPMSRVSDIIETLMNETTRSKVSADQKSSIGITGLTVNESVNSIYGIPSGVYVAEVTEGSGADKAGIRKGYVITKFDGKTITEIQELTELLQYYPAGETVEITVKIPATGGNYSEKTLSVTLGSAKNTQSGTEEAPQINKDASIY
ncbi:S1C family serine protease [Eisenbergiella sp.]